MSLGKLTQGDFSAGMWQAVARHLIPNNGCYDINNGLLDDDGSVYGRGGSAYRTTNATYSSGGAGAAGTGMLGVWDGLLMGGYRTVIVYSTASGNQVSQIKADETTPEILAILAPQSIQRMFEFLGALILIPDQTASSGAFAGHLEAYGGSRIINPAGSGAQVVTVTTGSLNVTGVGTSWLTAVDPGMFFQKGVSADPVLIAKVNSNTSLTLARPWTGPTATSAGWGALPVLDLVNYPIGDWSTTLTCAAAVPCGGSPRLAVAGKNRVYFTEAGKFVLSEFGVVNNNYHELPSGVEILGMEAIRDTLFLFTTHGVWAVYNMALDLVDDFGNVQHRLELVAKDIRAWAGNQGIASLGSRIVIPALDGVYMVDGSSSPKLVSQPITTRYRNYVKLGYQPGVATVFRGHYFLPILDSSLAFVDLLVCRVDRPIQGPGGVSVFPWSRLSGFGAQVRALAPLYRGGSTNTLLGAPVGSARVLNLKYLEPSAANKADADTSVPTPSMTSKDIPTGTNNLNIVRRLRVRHETLDAASDNPTWTAYVTTDGSASEVALSGTAPEDDGRVPFQWPVNKRTRFFRWRLQGNNAAASRVIRSVETFVRPGRRP